jgi:hypothetical protein
LLGSDERAIHSDQFLSNRFSSIISSSSLSLSSSSSAIILGANGQHLKIPLMFHGLIDIPVNAMIDSGASSSFIHYKFVQDKKIKTIPLPSPIPLYNIDNSGNTAGEITHMTIIETTIGENRRKLPFLVTDIGSESVILGIDWLRLENPTINWAKADVYVKAESKINSATTPTLPN